jgi:hypothetical protein
MKQLPQLSPFVLKVAIGTALVAFLGILAVMGVNVSEALRFSIVSAALITGTMAVWLIDYLGRFRWFRRIEGIPDFSGRWEGWHFFPGPTRQWAPIACELRQQGARILHGKAFADGATTETFATAIVTNSDASAAQLVWSFNSGASQGSYFLQLKDDGAVLEGVIVEILGPPTAEPLCGRMHMRRAGTRLRDRLKNDRDDWAMTKEEAGARPIH